MTNEELGPTDGVTPEWELEKQKQQAELDLFKIALEKERLLATQQLDLLTAQQDAIAGLIPKGEAKPLEGKIEADEKFGFVAELVAYSALREIASGVVNAINKDGVLPQPARVLIVDQLNVASGDLSLLEVRSQLSLFATSLAERIEELQRIVEPVAEEAVVEEEYLESMALGAATAAAVIPQLAVGALSATADILGFFKTDYSIKGREFDIDKKSLVAAVASKLGTAARQIYIQDFYRLAESSVVGRFADLQRQAIELTTLRDRLTNKHGASTDGAYPSSDQAKAAVASADTLLSAFKEYSKSVATADDDKSFPKLAQAALREQIIQMEVTHILHLDVLTSGGEAIIKKSPLRSSKTSFVGGVAACYILGTSEGSVVASDTVVRLSAFDYEFSGKSNSKVRRIPFQAEA